MRSASASLPAQPNQSLIDGLQVLSALAMGEQALGSREMARQLGMEPTRVNRLLKTLAYLGIAEQAADRRYRPGAGMHVLSAAALHASGLMRRAIGPLESLHRLGHLVALGVLWRGHTCYLYHATPGMNAALALGRAGLYPATQSGIGMALLAELPDDQLSALLADAEITGAVSPSALRRDLARFRRQGHALVAIPGSGNRSLAVGVGSPAFAAVALSGRFSDDEVPALCLELKREANVISTEQEKP